MEYGILALIPPVLAIGLALVLRNAYVGLIAGTYSVGVITSGWKFIVTIPKTLESHFTVFESSFNVCLFIDLILVGGLILLIEESGAINGLVDMLANKKGLIKSKKGSIIFTWLLGIIIFFSDNLSCLMTGAVTKSINEKFNVSKEKMAYVVHSTSTAVCLLIPIGGWGGYCIGLLGANGVENANATMFQSIPLNFFCIIVVLSVPVLALLGKDFGPMKKAERLAEQKGMENEDPADAGKVKIEGKYAGASNAIFPIVLLIVSIVVGIFVTGGGNFFEGEGQLALFYANIITTFATIALYMKRKLLTFDDVKRILLKGYGSMLPMILLLVMAFTFGSALTTIGTAEFISGVLTSTMGPSFYPMLVFLMAMLISFPSGTSMGTMAIVTPIVLPTAIGMGASIPLVAAAIWGGAIFGDQSSPVSDTTMLTCSTLEMNPVDHTRTQLPYTIGAAIISAALYLVFGFIL